MYPVHEIRCGWTMVVVAQTSKAAEKLPCTFYVQAYLIFFIRYFCRINRRCNKDVILNTKLLVCLVWPYLLLSMRKDCNSNKEWATCAKPAKNLGTRYRNVPYFGGRED